MNNNMTQALQDIDLIGLASFFMQADNIKENNQQKQTNQLILQAIANEINKLHKENNDIINYLKRVDNDEQKIIRRLDGLITILERRL